MRQFDQIATEGSNPRSRRLDEMSSIEIVRLMNEEDRRVAEAVAAETERIAEAVDVIANRLRQGGRLIYVGCGTSGRLGVLDASECPPTFSVPEGMVQALIAGGRDAVFRSAEGLEDDEGAGYSDADALNLSALDSVVGLAASGRTPYVIGAMKRAREIGCAVMSVTCSPNSEMAELSDIAICPQPGPEVISGSTRLKSGTAEKMVLNMLSTGAMVRLNKVYGNQMVDVRATNDKLRARAVRMVRMCADVSEDAAREALIACGWHAKAAIVALKANVTPERADALLEAAQGSVRKTISNDFLMSI